jgi:hypothetical protein
VSATDTRHIRHMLDEAKGIAAALQFVADDTIEYKGKEFTRPQLLERAANLASHAGQELLDEAMLAHGFPPV